MKKEILLLFKTKLLITLILLSTVSFSQVLDKSIIEEALSNNFGSHYIILDQNVSKKSGVTHIYIRQSLNGKEVYGTDSSLHFDKEGSIIANNNRFVLGIESTLRSNTLNIDATEAIIRVSEQMGYTISELKLLKKVNESTDKFIYNKAGISGEDIPVKLMYYYKEGVGTMLCWELSVQELTSSDWWNFRVNATDGTIIDKDNWTVYCEFPKKKYDIVRDNSKSLDNNFSLFKEDNNTPFMVGSYNVYPIPVESPNHGSRAVITNPEDLNASPYGWHDTNGASGSEYTITRGNNVLAQEDVNGNNGTGSRADGGGSLNFNFPLDLNQQPINYQDAALTNLFFWNNIMHDVYYQYGFDEASGNFQENNYGNGGTATDYVLADAQDGSGINNANFGTPTDGSNPRMQMFLWDPVPPIITFTVNSPAGIAGTYNAVQASFGPDVPTSPLTTDFVLFDDNTAPDNNDACETAVNGGAMNGKIVIIRRGSCAFVDKVQRAQDEGAVAVVMVNNVSGSPIIMGGTSGTITIPSVMVSQTDGEAIISQLEVPTTVNGTLVGTTAGTVNVDGDLDNGIIAHEYGHGISNRLTGGRFNSSCLSNAEQMGEGWSDYFGLMLTIEAGDTRTDSRGIGTYAIGESTAGGGIRPAPYSTDFSVNDFTYADTNDTAAISQPHGIGFVWCTMLWDMTWDLIDKYGFDDDFYYGTGGNNISMNLVTEALKLQPCSPGFVDGRDAILAADLALYGGENQCLIWNAFAQRGLGASASQGSTSSRTDQTEAFDFPSTTYNGSWSNGTPSLGKAAIFNQNYNTNSGNIEACSCTINGGSTVTVSAGDYMLIESDITVNGSLIVEHEGSIVQIDSDGLVTNNGTINVNLTTPNLASRDFMLLGSPMTSETRTGVWNSAFLVLNHVTTNFVPNPDVATAFPLAENFADDNYDNWIAYNSGINTGEGYIVRPQTGYGQPGGIFNYTYNQGTLNNGDINFNVLYNTPGPLPADNKNASPNILANPYASAIWADDFINANSMVDELYFWEHNTPPSPSLPGAGAMNFSMEDISMYNLSGGTAAASGGSIPNGYIATGQGFAIKANAAGTATFTNTMRRTDNNNTLRSVDETLERIWLEVTNPLYEMQSSTLIAFSENCTPDIDQGYDSRRIATVVSLYSQLEDGTGEFGIQSREKFNNGVKVPLGFSSLIDEKLNYEISIRDLEGNNLNNAQILLVDLYEKTTVNLKNNDYEFESDNGTFADRFVLIFQRPNLRLGVEKTKIDSISIFPNPTKGQITVLSPNSKIERITVYDLQGRQIITMVETGEAIELNISKLRTSVYFLEIETEAGTITKRIIKN